MLKACAVISHAFFTIVLSARQLLPTSVHSSVLPLKLSMRLSVVLPDNKRKGTTIRDLVTEKIWAFDLQEGDEGRG
jgi:hypothetical protein